MNWTLGTAADTDHIGDINDMVLNSLAAVKTGRLGLADNLFGIPVI